MLMVLRLQIAGQMKAMKTPTEAVEESRGLKEELATPTRWISPRANQRTEVDAFHRHRPVPKSLIGAERCRGEIFD
jgi:hypothetical protein